MFRLTRALALASVSASVVFGAAQLKPGDQPRSFQIPGSLAKQGKYLAALAKLEAEREALMKDPVEKEVYPYVHALLLANLGLQEEALAEAFGPRIPDAEFATVNVAALDAAKRLDALRAISNEARKTQLVVLNEWHHVPQHRAFGLLLARELWKQGYRYIAFEAMTGKDAVLKPNGYTTGSTGYSGDPLFADFFRQAKRMGFKMVPYEPDTSELIAQKPEDRNIFRDRRGAENIRDRIFQNDPRAKVMVYCGGDHVMETEINTPGKPYKRLAGYLKEILNIDPLTVDQMTEQYFNSKATQEPFRYAQRKGWVPRPTVFGVGGSRYWTSGPLGGKVDMVVFHPAPSRRQGRPGWIAMDGYRRPFRVDSRLRPTSGRRLATAIVKGEGMDAVPMDMAIVSPSGEMPSLFLPRGEYVFRVQDEDGNIVHERAVRQR